MGNELITPPLTTDQSDAVRTLCSNLAWLSGMMDGVIDGHDPFGAGIGVAFDCALELYRQGEEVPAEWEFSPGMGMTPETVDPEEYQYREEIEGRPADWLRLVGNVAAKVMDAATRLGFDY